MSKYIVETYYTCTFKIVHKLDELNEQKLSELENRNDGNVQIIDVKLKDPIDFELKIQIQKLMYEMPKWAPAELNGRKVSSRIFLPIRIHFQ